MNMQGPISHYLEQCENEINLATSSEEQKAMLYRTSEC